MSEQQADDESVEVPQDTGADAPDPSKSDDSSGSGDSDGSSDSGSGDGGPAEPGAVSDEELPEDLQATEDNPLARHPRQTGDEDDRIGADSETGDADNPSANMTYGEDSDDEDGSTGEGDDSGDDAS